jgi:YidC/Oxa1 family membrane protein insertase
MEQKFDLNSIIGFALIFVILIFYHVSKSTDPKWLQQKKAQKALQIKEAKAKALEVKKLSAQAVAATGDTTQLAQLEIFR